MIEYLVKTLRNSASFNPGVQVFHLCMPCPVKFHCGNELDPWYALGLQYGRMFGDCVNAYYLILTENRIASEATK